MTRRYDQRRRAESAGATRERIVAATMALHAERGVVATSFRDVAERAAVSVGSVYHHFPSLDALVTACGSELWRTTRPPDPESIASIGSRHARLRQLVDDVFSWYDRYPGWRRGLCDADKLDVLAKGVERREEHLRSLVVAAVDDGAERLALALCRATIDFEVYRNLRESDVSNTHARVLVADLLCSYFDA